MQKSLLMENLTGSEYVLPIGSTLSKLDTFIATHEEV